MKFDWSEAKNAANLRKHGIEFEQVLPLFDGEFVVEYDADHSTLEEERYLAKGYVKELGRVVVVFVEVYDDLIRIISARAE